MKTVANALFVSAKQEEFESKGKNVVFQRVVLMAADDDDTISLPPMWISPSARRWSLIPSSSTSTRTSGAT